ncbi:MAG: hypothetical protein U1F76_28485 [Candidatus Competibacteraceae bacterium]
MTPSRHASLSGFCRLSSRSNPAAKLQFHRRPEITLISQSPAA